MWLLAPTLKLETDETRRAEVKVGASTQPTPLIPAINNRPLISAYSVFAVVNLLNPRTRERIDTHKCP